MASVNPLLARWQAGQPTLGGWLTTADPQVAEYLATCGFDEICVDQQHGLADGTNLAAVFRALELHGVAPTTRVPANDFSAIGKALDVGATAIIVPMVGTPDEAAAAAAACHYPPRGNRSVGPLRGTFVRASDRLDALDQAACVVMIETAEGVRNADAIAATPGVDAIYIGPGDLALGLGLSAWPADWTPEEAKIHAEAIERIREACLRARRRARDAHRRRCGRPRLPRAGLPHGDGHQRARPDHGRRQGPPRDGPERGRFVEGARSGLITATRPARPRRPWASGWVGRGAGLLGRGSAGCQALHQAQDEPAHVAGVVRAAGIRPGGVQAGDRSTVPIEHAQVAVDVDPAERERDPGAHRDRAERRFDERERRPASRYGQLPGRARRRPPERMPRSSPGSPHGRRRATPARPRAPRPCRRRPSAPRPRRRPRTAAPHPTVTDPAAGPGRGSAGPARPTPGLRAGARSRMARSHRPSSGSRRRNARRGR